MRVFSHIISNELLKYYLKNSDRERVIQYFNGFGTLPEPCDDVKNWEKVGELSGDITVDNMAKFIANHVVYPLIICRKQCVPFTQQMYDYSHNHWAILVDCLQLHSAIEHTIVLEFSLNGSTIFARSRFITQDSSTYNLADAFKTEDIFQWSGNIYDDLGQSDADSPRAMFRFKKNPWNDFIGHVTWAEKRMETLKENGKHTIEEERLQWAAVAQIASVALRAPQELNNDLRSIITESKSSPLIGLFDKGDFNTLLLLLTAQISTFAVESGTPAMREALSDKLSECFERAETDSQSRVIVLLGFYPLLEAEDTRKHVEAHLRKAYSFLFRDD